MAYVHSCIYAFEYVCLSIAKLKAQKLPIQFIQHSTAANTVSATADEDDKHD